MLLTVQSLPFSGEGGNWCRIFVQMEVPLVPLSSKTFSKRMRTMKLQACCGLCQSLRCHPLQSSPAAVLSSLCSFSPPEEIHSLECFFKINSCSISFPVFKICAIVMRRKMHILLTVILILYAALFYIIRTRPRQVSVSNDGLPTL